MTRKMSLDSCLVKHNSQINAVIYICKFNPYLRQKQFEKVPCIGEKIDWAMDITKSNNKASNISACPRVKQSFFPPSSSALFQEYLRPYGSAANDRKRCSSYSRPIDGT